MALLRARLAGKDETSSVPVSVLMVQAGISLALADIARDTLPPIAYAVFTLATCAALISIPLLGELGAFLRADEATEWVEALPARPLDLKLARTLHVLTALFVLSLASLVPAGLLLPVAGIAAKAGLVAAGLGQALFLAAALLCMQSLFGGRAEPLLILLQTFLVVLVVAGTVMGMRLLPQMADWVSTSSLPPLARGAFPPAWFAAAVFGSGTETLVAAGISVAAATALVLVPAPAPPKVLAGGIVGRVLSPLRSLAARLWVRRDERAVFALVCDALPREREFKLRTYPLLGIPLAFLLVGASSEQGVAREGLLGLILFTPPAYFPVLLSHVSTSASHKARWILDSAPIAESAIRNGALKALVVRFIAPLYAMLAALAWVQSGGEFAARIALPGFLCAVIVSRILYPMCVEKPPLSTPPDEVAARIDWFGPMAAVAMILTIAAILAVRFVSTPWHGLLVAGGLVAVEVGLDRRARQPG